MDADDPKLVSGTSLLGALSTPSTHEQQLGDSGQVENISTLYMEDTGGKIKQWKCHFFQIGIKYSNMNAIC